MSEMKFNVKCVKACLVNSGRVFTVREWKGPASQECFVDVQGVGRCKKIRIGEVKSTSDIARYVKLSGFDSVDAWWRKINEFHACPGWIFLVVKVD